MCRIIPIVTIKIAEGRSLEIKRRLVASVTEAISTSLEMDSSYVTVLIKELE
jgi:4-oxalocrotonate tautomerase family enzyme